jgi:fumarylacetoacetate (FAA) hydrolase family protein
VPWFLAPCDLQAIKASGVTFVSSLLERVIEEQTRGNPSKAAAVRRSIASVIGDNLSAVKPGSSEAQKTYFKAICMIRGSPADRILPKVELDRLVSGQTALVPVGGHGFT